MSLGTYNKTAEREQCFNAMRIPVTQLSTMPRKNTTNFTKVGTKVRPLQSGQNYIQREMGAEILPGNQVANTKAQKIIYRINAVYRDYTRRLYINIYRIFR